MRRPRAQNRHAGPAAVPGDAQRIDALYGLDPVFEPATCAGDGAAGVEVQSVQCPYCGEDFETTIDVSEGRAQYVEDCQVCCQPIEFSLEVDHAGVLVAVSTARGD